MKPPQPNDRVQTYVHVHRYVHVQYVREGGFRARYVDPRVPLVLDFWKSSSDSDSGLKSEVTVSLYDVERV